MSNFLERLALRHLGLAPLVKPRAMIDAVDVWGPLTEVDGDAEGFEAWPAATEPAPRTVRDPAKRPPQARAAVDAPAAPSARTGAKDERASVRGAPRDRGAAETAVTPPPRISETVRSQRVKRDVGDVGEDPERADSEPSGVSETADRLGDDRVNGAGAPVGGQVELGADRRPTSLGLSEHGDRRREWSERKRAGNDGSKDSNTFPIDREKPDSSREGPPLPAKAGPAGNRGSEGSASLPMDWDRLEPAPGEQIRRWQANPAGQDEREGAGLFPLDRNDREGSALPSGPNPAGEREDAGLSATERDGQASGQVDRARQTKADRAGQEEVWEDRAPQAAARRSGGEGSEAFPIEGDGRKRGREAVARQAITSPAGKRDRAGRLAAERDGRDSGQKDRTRRPKADRAVNDDRGRPASLVVDRAGPEGFRADRPPRAKTGPASSGARRASLQNQTEKQEDSGGGLVRQLGHDRAGSEGGERFSWPQGPGRDREGFQADRSPISGHDRDQRQDPARSHADRVGSVRDLPNRARGSSARRAGVKRREDSARSHAYLDARKGGAEDRSRDLAGSEARATAANIARDPGRSANGQERVAPQTSPDPIGREEQQRLARHFDDRRENGREPQASKARLDRVASETRRESAKPPDDRDRRNIGQKRRSPSWRADRAGVENREGFAAPRDRRDRDSGRDGRTANSGHVLDAVGAESRPSRPDRPVAAARRHITTGTGLPEPADGRMAPGRGRLETGDPVGAASGRPIVENPDREIRTASMGQPVRDKVQGHEVPANRLASEDGSDRPETPEKAVEPKPLARVVRDRWPRPERSAPAQRARRAANSFRGHGAYLRAAQSLLLGAVDVGQASASQHGETAAPAASSPQKPAAAGRRLRQKSRPRPDQRRHRTGGKTSGPSSAKALASSSIRMESSVSPPSPNNQATAVPSRPLDERALSRTSAGDEGTAGGAGRVLSSDRGPVPAQPISRARRSVENPASSSAREEATGRMANDRARRLSALDQKPLGPKSIDPDSRSAERAAPTPARAMTTVGKITGDAPPVSSDEAPLATKAVAVGRRSALPAATPVFPNTTDAKAAGDAAPISSPKREALAATVEEPGAAATPAIASQKPAKRSAARAVDGPARVSAPAAPPLPAWPARRAGRRAQPPVRIHIGQVDVAAVHRPRPTLRTTPAASVAAAKPAGLTLDQYLASRNGARP